MQPGLARLTDEVATGARAGLGDDLWRLAYVRSRTDIDRARPYLDRPYAGILVLARPAGDGRTLIVIDTGERLVGAVDRFPAVPVGSAVRLGPAGFGEAVTWKLVVDEAFPLDATVRFDVAASRGEAPWIAWFREALVAIRDAEQIRREAIAAQRRALPPFETAPSIEALLQRRVEVIRREAARETDYSPLERAEFEQLRALRQRGSYADQRRAHEREETLLRARQERFNTLVRERLAALKTALSELQAQRAAIFARNEATHAALRRLEDADLESRARTAEVAAAERYLERLAEAPLTVEGLDESPVGLDDAECARDVLRAIALLARAVPRFVNVRVAV